MLKQVVYVSLLALAAQASLFGSRPDLDVKATFGEANPFAQVVNGASNKLYLKLQNHSPQELTVKYISGSFHEKTSSGKERLLKNSTAAKYDIKLPPSQTQAVAVTYQFYSEFKPAELLYNVWVDYADAKGKLHRETAYEGQVTVVEKPGSWFDPALLFAYSILAALIGLIGLVVYNTFIVTDKKRRVNLLGKKPGVAGRPAAPEHVKSDAEIKAEKEEWMPAHHSSAQPRRSARKSGAATSGDDTDPGYSSGGLQKRKARK